MFTIVAINGCVYFPLSEPNFCANLHTTARAEARAGGTPSAPVLKAQPLGYQVKSLHESSLKMKVQSSVEFMNQKVRAFFHPHDFFLRVGMSSYCSMYMC